MPTEHSADITQAISQFEAAWARGESPQLGSFIPPNEADNVELVAELVAVDLERRLKADESIRVETYLEQFPRLAASPGDVVNLIVAEYQHRGRQTPGLAIDEYLERFPQYRDWLSARLSNIDETQPYEGPFPATESPAASNATRSTAAQLLDRMVEFQLLTAETISHCREELAETNRQDHQQVIDTLLSDGRITAWQLKQVRAGQKTFVLENGRYLLLDELGKGGMGSVYRARHIGLNREVALKTIDPGKAKNKELVARFQREITLCAKLQHEHIVQAYDMGCHQNVYFLVLEYVAGADLSSIVKSDGPMWPDEVAAVGLQIAAALVYAHAQGVIHRDIKPHNILLSTDGIAKLLDLGLASDVNQAEDEALTSLTQTGMVLGTADYMPPEQAADLTKVDGRSDTYSLGATLYYLLTGRPPFPGGDMMSKMHRLANEEPAAIGQLRPDCPRELANVVERMLSKRPEERYQSTVDVVRALQPLAAARISGRNVVTHAVRTAADAETTVPRANTIAVTPFEFAANDTVATSLSRHRKQSSLGKWLIGTALAVPLLLGIGIWAATSGNSEQQSPSDDGISPPPESADKNNPPSQLRINSRNGYFHHVKTVAWSPDSDHLAACCDNGEIRIWHANSLKTTAVYTGHRGVPYEAVFSPDGRVVVSWDSAREIHAWDAKTGKKLFETDELIHGGNIAFSPDGKDLAYNTRSGLVRWSIERKKQLHLVTKQTYSRIGFSPTGRYLAGIDGRQLNVWDLNTPQANAPHWVMPRHDTIRSPHRLFEVEFAGDHNIAVTGDGFVEFWNVAQGTLERKVEVPRTGEKRYFLDFAAKAKHLIVATDEGFQRVETETGKVESTTPWTGFAGIRGSVSPDGYRHCVETSTTLDTILNFQDQSTHRLPLEKIFHRSYFSLLGKRYIYLTGNPSPSLGSIGGIDLATAKMLDDLPVHSGRATHDNNGRFLFFVDDHVESWAGEKDSDNHHIFPKFEEFDTLSPKRQYYGGGWTNGTSELWFYSRDRKQTFFWNVETGKNVRTLAVESEDETIIAPNASRLVLRRRWNSTEEETTFQIHPLDGQANSKPTLLRFDAQTYDAAVAGDGSRLAFKIHGFSPRVVISDASSGREVVDLPVPQEMAFFYGGSAIQAIHLSQSGRYLLLHDCIYDLDSKPVKPFWQASAHSSAMYDADLLGDEQHAVLAFPDRYEVWDWRKNKKRMTIYLLPNYQWMVFNHETRNWNGSNFAFRHVKCLHRDAEGKEEWVVPFVYERRTGWENDPAKAGLADLIKK